MGIICLSGNASLFLSCCFFVGAGLDYIPQFWLHFGASLACISISWPALHFTAFIKKILGACLLVDAFLSGKTKHSQRSIFVFLFCIHLWVWHWCITQMLSHSIWTWNMQSERKGKEQGKGRK